MQIIYSKVRFHVLRKWESDEVFHDDHIANVTNNQKDAETYLLMELNNYGGEYQLRRILTIKMESKDGLCKRIMIDTEILDMTEKIEEYKKQYGGLRSEAYGNPQFPRKENKDV